MRRRSRSVAVRSVLFLSSPSLKPPSLGLNYLPLHRTIVLALSSSSFHAIALDPTPTLVSPHSHLPTSSQLTSITRQLWLHVARRKQVDATTNTRDAPLSHILSIQGAKTSGFATFGVDGEMGWACE